MDSQQEKLLKSKNAELEKQLAAKNRELEIEAALERVRTVAMSMMKPDDLPDICEIMFHELKKLGFTDLRNAMINVHYDDKKYLLNYDYSGVLGKTVTRFTYNSHPIVDNIVNHARQSSEDFTEMIYSGKALDEWRIFRKNNGEPDDEQFDNINALYYYFYSIGNGAIGISNFSGVNHEQLNILKRFRNVFDLAYKRYIDITTAEAQAREAQIEAALERVRARTMAMQHSSELKDAALILFKQVELLGVKTWTSGFQLWDDNRQAVTVWTCTAGVMQQAFRLPADDERDTFMMHVISAEQNGEALYVEELSGKILESHYNYMASLPGLKDNFASLSDAGIALPLSQVNNAAFFSYGYLLFITYHPIPEAHDIFKRFAKVFEQTYTRFNDLKIAEAQAREAQIEAALERVRSRTMGMQKSEELAEVIQLVYDQLCQLNFNIDNANFVVNYKESDDLDLWLAVNGQRYSTKMHIPYLDHPIFNRLNEAKKKGLSFFSDSLTFEEKNAFFRHLFKNAPEVPQERKKAVFESPGYARSVVFMKTIALSIQNYAAIPYSDAENEVLVRFGKVFEQTYTRFNDLKIAEEQVREATIEAALERVRSKAMAMRSSGDVNATANTVFIELRKLDVDLVRCGLGLMEKESHISTIHAATNSAEGGSLEVLGNIDMNIHPILEGIYNQWRQSKDYFPVLEEESLRTYYEALHESGISVPKWKSGEKQYGYFLQFAYGSLYAWSGKQESEITIKTLKRFTSVIGLTYTRYIELQKAESNTKEAIKQASLDRVRAEIASMRKQSDLERITPLIWEELTILGIPFIRCGVFIMDEEQKLIHTFLSTPDGKAIGAFHIPFDTSGNFKIMVDNWRHKEPYIDHWKEEAFSQFADALVKQGAITSKAQYMRTLPHEGVHLNFLPFLQGMLYVGNVSPFAEDNIDLIQAVADAFSTAYARYEDFNKLEAAKQQVENTLSDLKAAQTKLIQSEKMASLGELTAGIAHEIQNPLNFVNNFSEVNQEMIDELEEELKAGNIEEALAIAADIKQNEEKISHHGKRADGIVKGMLQHSRTGGGEKQLTNMNTLADEFLRLSYHGLRAKDKTFNAEMVTHFDPDLPKINVIVQDMGRVMLNLFNNAFYAVNQKSKTAGFDYKPEVSVSTSSENGHVTIKVKDNGTGIPESIKEKIMQPFFTTKPTGEGTGLGLSLTYDMVVKGHGGTIIVNTKEGEFTELVVQLTT